MLWEKEKKELRERRERKERNKKKKKEREREEKRKREEVENKEQRLDFSLERYTNSYLLVLLPREDLFIKEQWHQQWKEERMIEKEDTSLERCAWLSVFVHP